MEGGENSKEAEEDPCAPMNLNLKWINCKISSDAGKREGQRQLRKIIVKHANSKAHLTLANFSWIERNKKMKMPLFPALIT